MLRGMVFVDHMNFDIALRKLYSDERQTPKLDYNTLFPGIVKELPNIDFLKAMLFSPKPDDFLMNDPHLRSYYKWTEGLKNAKYLDVVHGRYIARPVDEEVPMDISNRLPYYKVEKGTDINMAVHILTKAFYDSFDVAFVVSADTDYLTVYQQLKTMGKIVVLVTVKGQPFGNIKSEVDNFIILNKDFFSRHLRVEKTKSENLSSCKV